jgi:hypothetical protein
MIKEGEARYKSWQRKIQSLSYLFKEESQQLFDGIDLKKFLIVLRDIHPF